MTQYLDVNLELEVLENTDIFEAKGEMRFNTDTDIELFLGDLEIVEITIDGEMLKDFQIFDKSIKIEQQRDAKIVYLTYNDKLVIPVPKDCKLRFSHIRLSPEHTLLSLRENQQDNYIYGQNCRIVLIPSYFTELGKSRIDPKLSKFIPVMEQLEKSITLFEGFYNGISINSGIVLYLPRNAPLAALKALFYATELVASLYAKSNVSLSIRSSVSKHALLIHFFLGFLAFYDYANCIVVIQSLLLYKYNSLDAKQFYYQYNNDNYNFAACLALATIPVKFVKEIPQFSEENDKATYNDAVKECFKQYEKEYNYDIFPTDGIEPGAVFEQSFVDRIQFDAKYQQFMVKKYDKFGVLQFFGAPSKILKLNKLRLDCQHFVKNDDILRFRSEVDEYNAFVQQNLNNIQLFTNNFATFQQVSELQKKTAQMPVEQQWNEVLTRMQCYDVSAPIPLTYQDCLFDQIVSRAQMFNKYACQAAPLFAKPLYYQELKTSTGPIVFKLLQFNQVGAGRQLALLSEIACDLYQYLKYQIVKTFAQQSFERSLPLYARRCIETRFLLFGKCEAQTFELIEDVKVFLRGIALNYQAPFLLREKAVEFLIFLGDGAWSVQILDYLFDELTESYSKQVEDLLESFWPIIVCISSISCENVLNWMLENSEAGEFWLARMKYGYVSQYTMQKCDSNSPAFAEILIAQIMVFQRQKEENVDQLMEMLRALPFDSYKYALARAILQCREVPECIITLLEQQNFQDLDIFVQEVLKENKDFALLQVHMQKKDNAYLQLFMLQTDFLDWNIKYVPLFTGQRYLLFDAADESCPKCYCQSCYCNSAKMLKIISGNREEGGQNLELLFGEYQIYEE